MLPAQKGKKPKKIVSTSGGPRNSVVKRPAPRSRLNRFVLRSTIAPPGAPCLRLTIKSY